MLAPSLRPARLAIAARHSGGDDRALLPAFAVEERNRIMPHG